LFFVNIKGVYQLVQEGKLGKKTLLILVVLVMPFYKFKNGEADMIFAKLSLE
jgi:hypothetical protein